MRKVTHRLRRAFAGTRSDDKVIEAVTTARQRFDGKPIRDSVPILVGPDRRRTAARIRSAAGPAASASGLIGSSGGAIRTGCPGD
ncbi:three-helix bundle dimerization domain-containing protein [Spirillospora sp. CA-142024]|uniref:three-helix bundle dimerization domain-containing protein n=1 Tax=Spirillospora sp. CA-142024 TaxID=3240036 RepID=UPI003D930C32